MITPVISLFRRMTPGIGASHLRAAGRRLTVVLVCAVTLMLITQPSAADDRPQLGGVWLFGSCSTAQFDLRCMILAEDDRLLTDRARAYRDAIDEAAQPKYDCAPMPIPHMWTDPYSYRIEQLEDRVLIYYGKDDVVRTVWLEGHGHERPAVNEFFYFGYATGRYEDGALVVVTDRFTFDPQGLNADFRLPSSTQKQVTERFSRDGDNIILQVTTIDTFFLREPWTFTVTSRPDPEPWDGSWECDLEGARHALRVMPPMYPDDPPVQRLDY